MVPPVLASSCCDILAAVGAFVGGDISWKTCQNSNVESRFYDPLFPQADTNLFVSSAPEIYALVQRYGRRLALRFPLQPLHTRATLTDLMGQLEYGSSRFLTNLEQDVANFKAGVSTVLR
eukprot:556556-Hanusia_phi.AAC.1